MDGQMDRQTSGWMDGWIDIWVFDRVCKSTQTFSVTVRSRIRRWQCSKVFVMHTRRDLDADEQGVDSRLVSKKHTHCTLTLSTCFL